MNKIINTIAEFIGFLFLLVAGVCFFSALFCLGALIFDLVPANSPANIWFIRLIFICIVTSILGLFLSSPK